MCKKPDLSQPSLTPPPTACSCDTGKEEDEMVVIKEDPVRSQRVAALAGHGLLLPAAGGAQRSPLARGEGTVPAGARRRPCQRHLAPREPA